VEEEANESFGGVVPSVGKAPKSRGPKKKIAKNLAAAVIPDKDDDGSTRVLGYRGVWLKNGKYFIKVGGVAVTKNVEGKETTLLLDKLEEAAKRYDDVITTRGRAREVELNYREDGSRIMVRYWLLLFYWCHDQHHLIVFVCSMMTKLRRHQKRVQIPPLLCPHLPWSTSKICQNTLNLCFVTQTRRLAQVEIQNDMYMHTVVFAVSKGKVMIVGKARYLSMVKITTLELLILNGMLQLCMVRAFSLSSSFCFTFF
jgi:hypothetical protein